MHQMPADRHEEPKPGGCWPVLLMVLDGVCIAVMRVDTPAPRHDKGEPMDVNDPYAAVEEPDRPDSVDILDALQECIGNIPHPLWEFLEQGLNGDIELSNGALRAFIFDVTGVQP